MLSWTNIANVYYSVTVSCTLSLSHSKLVKLTCDCCASASDSLSIFVWSDVILLNLFHNSPSAPTSCSFCIPHAGFHFFSWMLLASVHHLDFMAHDVSASRNLDSELPFGESPPGLSSALNQFQCQQYAHWAGVLMAFCTKKCCSPMLIVKVSLHCLHQDVISAGKFRWLTSGKEPALFSKDMSMATWVLQHVARPSLTPSEPVLDINDNSPQVCVRSNPVLSVMSTSLPVLFGLPVTS